MGTFDFASRPGYLMRLGVKHLPMIWAATDNAMKIPQFAILVELGQHDGGHLHTATGPWPHPVRV